MNVDLLGIPVTITPWMVLLALMLLVVDILVMCIVASTREIYFTIGEILSDKHSLKTVDDRLRPMIVSYGIWHLPFTLTRHPRSMHISVPAGRIPHIRDEEQANDLGRQIRDTYSMQSAFTTQHVGTRYWELRR